MTDESPACFFPSITLAKEILCASIEGSSRCTVTPIAFALIAGAGSLATISMRRKLVGIVSTTTAILLSGTT